MSRPLTPQYVSRPLTPQYGVRIGPFWFGASATLQRGSALAIYTSDLKLAIDWACEAALYAGRDFDLDAIEPEIVEFCGERHLRSRFSVLGRLEVERNPRQGGPWRPGCLRFSNDDTIYEDEEEVRGGTSEKSAEQTE